MSLFLTKNKIINQSNEPVRILYDGVKGKRLINQAETQA